MGEQVEGAAGMTPAGLGGLSQGGRARERMRLNVLPRDLGEVTARFFDDAHDGQSRDALGIRAVDPGRHAGVDGSVSDGASVPDLVAVANPEVGTAPRGALDVPAIEVKAVTEAGFSKATMLMRARRR